MIDAHSAYLNTDARLEVLAKEFIINEVSKTITNVISKGYFTATIDVDDTKLDGYMFKELAPRVCKILREEWHYDADTQANVNGFIYAINIDWSTADGK